jgi:carbamoyltransferase
MTEDHPFYTLGIHGGVNTIKSHWGATPVSCSHDAAAVLCRDGEIVAAAEEERFIRIKHINYFPIEAIRHCLNSHSITLENVAKIVFSSDDMNQFVKMVSHWRYATRHWLYPNTFAEFAANVLNEEFGVQIADKIICADHHLSHALSTVWMSGFPESLCIVMDNWGDGLTGLIASFRDGKLEILRTMSDTGPAGMYLMGTELIGFYLFDEYKVMGLAPYGDPSEFAKAFSESVILSSQGHFAIRNPTELGDLKPTGFNRAYRTPGQPLEQRHKNFAAALQDTAERILFHVLEHFRTTTHHRYLCLAGGFAQNCTANGKVLKSGLFEEVFVQPAAYDAGCAIGAAIHGYISSGGKIRNSRMSHLYLGHEIPDDPGELTSLLEPWMHVINVERPADVCATAAELIANGRVIGWVQGRAEFGARALGNRSILADPRPAENKTRINGMVKKRESFRPFAPSVLEEYLHKYFELPENVRSLPFMVFVVKVREPYRRLLGAVTHVDGTARVQSISRETNERYWRLIEHVYKLIGVPIVLNTSFNNNAEPIVNTVIDALNCFLSTQIDYLVVGDVLVRRKVPASQSQVLRHLKPQLTHRFSIVRQSTSDGTVGYYIFDRYNNSYFEVSPAACDCLLESINRRVRFDETTGSKSKKFDAIISELFELWSRRVFICNGE